MTEFNFQLAGVMTGSTERTSQLLGQTEVIFKNTLLQ